MTQLTPLERLARIAAAYRHSCLHEKEQRMSALLEFELQQAAKEAERG